MEIAAVAPLTGATFETFVRLPDGVSMNPKAEEATGLFTSQFRDPSLPDFRAAYHAFLEFVCKQVDSAGAGALPVFVGHNIADYDLPLLMHRARDVDMPAPRTARVLDTLRAARQIFTGVSKLRDYKLEPLYKCLTGLDSVGAHRAAADVAMTLGVLRALIGHGTGLQGEDGFVQFFSRPSFPNAFDSGWIAHLTAAPRSHSSVEGRRKSAIMTRSQFGAQAIEKDLFVMGGSSQGAPSAIESEEFSMQAWAADDPLAVLESRQMEESEADRLAVLRTQCTWRELAADAARLQTFLTQPVEKVHVASRYRFTPTQVKDLQAAGLPRLIDVLHCFPRGYTAASAARLPDLSIDGEQAVCLAVKVESAKVSIGPPGSNWAVLTAVLSVVVTPEHGNGNGCIGGLSKTDADSGRRPRLVIKTFRRGRSARWAIEREQEMILLRNEGSDYFGVAARVQRADGQWGPDAWMIKDGSVEYLTPGEFDGLVNGGATHVRVSYPQRGFVSAIKLSAAANKGLEALREGAAAGKWEDPVPEVLRRRYDLVGYAEALAGMHSPSGPEEYSRSQRRLVFQELFTLQLKLMLQRAQLRVIGGGGADEGGAIAMQDMSLVDLARASLPFELTVSQEKAVEALLKGMAGWPPMMTLLQGDVGSGKTACAFLALLAAVGSGYQGAIMAPTEILAEQHCSGMLRLLEDMQATMSSDEMESVAVWSSSPRLPKVELLTGSTKKAERTRILAGLEDGSIDLVVGTHALITDSVVFSRLGLAVVDEQHKFGVAQRAKLLAKGCPSPHTLYMSATPIPRSLALVQHGEMNLVVINELPPGRMPVATRVMEDSRMARKELYAAMRAELAAGGQVYIVCPLVDGVKEAATSSASEDSKDREALDGEVKSSASFNVDGGLKAAVQERDRLVAEGELGADQCGVLHGRMSSEEKEAVMSAFAAGRTPVLVSTTVVEVGVDVPAASMMIVEHADRFGLAQLHQLRGRVGRGSRASLCFLMTGRHGDAARRLRLLERSSSGFEIAEADFGIRGAGDVLGRRQSGRETTSTSGGLTLFQLPQDAPLVECAREAAALHIRDHPRPEGWPRELLSAVVDPSLLDIDLAELPTMSG